MAEQLPEWHPSARELDDLEVLLLGGYAPLRGFVLEGAGSPPVTLRVPDDVGRAAAAAGGLRLVDEEGTPVAELKVDEVREHGDHCEVAGEVFPLRPFESGTHRELRRSPAEVRARFAVDGGPLLGVPIRSPLHASDVAAVRLLADDLGARVLLLPLVGRGSPQGIDAAGLVRICLGLRDELRRAGVVCETVPVPVPDHGADEEAERVLAARVAGNYGATHVARARVPSTLPPADDLPVAVQLPAVVHDLRTGRWDAPEAVPEVWRGPWLRTDVPDLVRRALAEHTPVPIGLSLETTLRELRRAQAAAATTGVTVLFTGLSGSGKSTLAKAVHAALTERTDRTATLLDGDVVRRMLSAGLGFSRPDRELNVRRIGFVAAEITRHRGIALCAPIAPYASTRAEVREMVEEHGRFVLVHVCTPLEVCEARDRKGLYAKARRGEIPHFTGVCDPYEEPTDADLAVDTSTTPLGEAVEAVLAVLGAGASVRPPRGPRRA
jgi:sulfate adenylyltransferase